MRHRPLLVVAALAAIVALVASLSVAVAGTKRSSHATRAEVSPPAVPNAAALRKKYHGQSLQFIGDAAVGKSHQRDLKLVAKFSKDTGIKIDLVPHPSASDASYQQLARAFGSKASKPDVAMMDVTWPGAFAPYLVNLKPKLGKASKKFVQSIIQNDTIGGKLVAMPWFGDFGILYYRTDLLKKYGYKAPPTTWSQLFAMAKKVQAGEQKSNNNFYGLVYQGNSYEGLTCDALEWIASAGGGHYIDNGKVTINNKNAAQILDAMRTQVGKITPRGVTSFDEEGARNVFAAGNAMFMRNWPYAYAANLTTPVKGKYNVTVLPHGAKGPSVGTVGGWQLGVSKYSKHKDAAIEFVRYMTSAAVQKFDAIYNSNVPTIVSVAKNKAVVKANPYLKPQIASVQRVTRPSKYLKANYNAGSKVIYQGINEILNGKSAKSELPSIASKLKRLVR